MKIELYDKIFTQLEKAFTENESARETSVEFKNPGPSAWNYAQSWAQQAVDRPKGAPLPEYTPVYDALLATNRISYAIGVAMGRFGPAGEGILDEAPDSSLPAGILYLSGHNDDDSLSHPACHPIKEAWAEHGADVGKRASLKDWLMKSFFKDVHLKMYEKKPIYFPLSSKRKNFVAHVSIHRWADDTLQTLLADYLIPDLNKLEGELADLMASRKEGSKKARSEAENRYEKAKTLREELAKFIDLARVCAEQGPPAAKAGDVARETDARFRMDLDDGVMINSAAQWPLLEPQWKQPKKWWSELCNAKGRKDYDWAHLAARYFPARVDGKCKKDPSLGVAHGCFWKYHPGKAHQWELRLQDEIEKDFTIDEEGSNDFRAAFEKEHPERVKALKAAEEKRREKKRKKANPGKDQKKEKRVRKKKKKKNTKQIGLFEKKRGGNE